MSDGIAGVLPKLIVHRHQLSSMKKQKKIIIVNNRTVSDFAAAAMMTNENIFKSDLIGSHN